MIVHSNTKLTNDLPGRIQFSKDDSVIFSDDSEYTINEQIGSGGFGSVYKVFQKNTSKVYALKILEFYKLRPSEIEGFLKRFERGYKAGLIPSKYLVSNYQYGFIENNPCVLMEFCNKGNLTLNQRLANNLNSQKRIIGEMCIGLHDLHENGFIHRDFKPENILLNDDDQIKICDFDISGRYGMKDSRLTIINNSGETEEIWGTIAYAAPEQMSHKDAYKYNGPQVDIYSLAVTIYEFISGGKLPFGTRVELNKNPSLYSKRKLKKAYEPISNHIPSISKNWTEFFELAFEPIPTKRINSIAKVMQLLEIEPLHTSTDKSIHINNLIIKTGEDIGKTYSFNLLFNSIGNNILKIGRLDDTNNNNISITETKSSFISRRHCTIERINQDYYLRDGQWDFINKNWINSLNGTFINGELAQNSKVYKLTLGDIITVGDCNLQVN